MRGSGVWAGRMGTGHGQWAGEQRWLSSSPVVVGQQGQTRAGSVVIVVAQEAGDSGMVVVATAVG